MKKNVASQVIGAQMVTAADGSAFTGAVTVAVTGDAGTQATGSVGSGACTHEGNGYHTYAPAQAETNYDLIAFTFTGSGAVPCTVQVYTSFPQTGDNYAVVAHGTSGNAALKVLIDAVDDLVDTEVAAIKTVVDAILVDTDVIGAAGAGLTALATQASVNTIDDLLDTEVAAIKTVVDAILVDTAEIGAAGAGLTALATQASVTAIDDLIDTEVAAIKTVVDAIEVDTQDIQSRIPAALSGGGNMLADLRAINGDAAALAVLEALMDGALLCQVNDAAATTTAFAADGFTEGTDDHFNGRLITFVSGALRYQQTDITDYDAAGHAQGSQAFVVSALTEAPANNDFFVIQ